MGTKGKRHDMPIKDRFEEKFQINKLTNCWEWQAGKDKDGYGKFTVKGKTIRANRASYEIYKGRIPDGLLVCHTCDYPQCVNPNHLFLGTAKINSLDMVAKQRSISQKRKTPHPSIHYYRNGCRCDDCKKLSSDYRKKRRQINGDHIRDVVKRYREKNHEKEKKYSRERYHENREENIRVRKENYLQNKNKILATSKEWRDNNKDKMDAYNEKRRWDRLQNLEKFREIGRENYHKQKLKKAS